jgi:hypothetical protein
MKNTFAAFVCLPYLFAAMNASAAVLTTEQADAICHRDAVAAAHFITKSERPFLVSAKAAQEAEISTPITYEFRYEKGAEALVTVVAYAYPDDKSCTLGTITNNIAGND